jgi:hypothetical protein
LPYPDILVALVKAGDGNLLGKNMRTVTENTATLLFCRKEFGLESQGSYVLILWLMNNIQVTTATCCRLVYSYENASLLKILEKTITNQNYIHKEIS